LLISSRSINKHGQHSQFLFLVAMGYSCFWLAEIKEILFSETRRHNALLLCRNGVWEILYKISIFRADHTTNMATIGSSCLWLANLKKSSLKPWGQINWNLVGNLYGKFCIKFPQNKMTGEWHRLSPLNL
jgi:hypothetical protein